MADEQQPDEQLVTDPFDLDRLRETPLEDIVVEQVMISISVRRPGRNEFFRVHPSDDYVVDSLVLEHESGLDRVTYWIAPELRAALLEDARRVRLYTCLSKRGVVFLWPAKLPVDDGGGRQWAASALVVAERAKTAWVRMRGNKDAGSYELFVAKGELPEPKWPNKTYRELIELGFDGKVVASLDHPVIRELEGRE